MSRPATAFIEARVKRGIAGARAAGSDVHKVEIDPDGKITLFCWETPASEEAPEDLSVFAARLAEERRKWRR